MHLSREQNIFKGRHFQKELRDRKMSLWRFVIGIQDWLASLFSSFHDWMCLNWQLYFWRFRKGSISTKGGKGTDTSRAWRSPCFLRAPCLHYELLLRRGAARGAVRVEGRGARTPVSPDSHSPNGEAERFWLPKHTAPMPIVDSLLTAAACDFGDLTEDWICFSPR